PFFHSMPCPPPISTLLPYTTLFRSHIGVQVRATFQSPSSVASAPSGVEIAIMDYNKPETIRAALQGVERVFLVGPPTQKLAALERQAMDQIKQSEVQHGVKLSVMGVRRGKLTHSLDDAAD